MIRYGVTSRIFQISMRFRIGVPQHIVEKYSTDICFMVKKDETLMEVVKPWKNWIDEMGYEVDALILDAYAEILLDADIDKVEKPCRTTQQYSLDVETDFN